MYLNEDVEESGIVKEQTSLKIFKDGSKFEGQWNKVTNMKHGRGY